MSDQVLTSVKTADLMDAALDWAVAKAEGLRINKDPMGGDSYIVFPDSKNPDWVWLNHYNPSENWALGGPIIEREIDLMETNRSENSTEATRYEEFHGQGSSQHGNTPLVAAMRCFVASKLGNEIEVPTALVPEVLLLSAPVSKIKP